MDASPTPATPTPRTEIIHLRVSPQEKKAIELAASAVRLPVSDFLRKTATQGQVMTEIGAAEQRLIGLFRDALKAADARADQRAMAMYLGIQQVLTTGRWEG